MFASVEIAARIERSETRLLEAACAEIARRRGDAYDGFCIPLAGGVAVYSGGGSPMNKIAGLGFAGIPLDNELDAVEARFAAHECAMQVELSALANPAIAQLLTRRGYVLMNFENVLGRQPTSHISSDHRDGAPRDELTVEVCGPDQFAEWLDVVVTGFESPDELGVQSHESFARADLERVFADMAAANGLVHYIARRGGVAAGGASVFIGDGVAHLAGAATLPAHRRRGVQTALLNRRLHDAHHRGCELAVITTQPGSKSQENAQRRGFELLYTRAVLVKE